MTHPAPSSAHQQPAEASQSGAAGVLREFPRAATDSPYLNRELSWLDFNGRVLALAADDRAPVLERVKFLAIFSTNLDEFFQVRVALLKEQQDAKVGGTSPDGLTPSEQVRAISTKVAELLDRQADIFHKGVVPALAEAGIDLRGWESLGEDDRAYLADVFETRIFPVLTPLAVDPGHPFPHISNLSLNLAVVVRNPRTGERRFARVKMPPLLPRFIALPDKHGLIPLEQVIAARLDELFPGMEIESHCGFRVTRNADLDIEEAEADDLLEAINLELRRRRFGKAVRLEVDRAMPDDVRDLLAHELDLRPGDIYESDGPLDLGDLWALHGLDRPDLKDEPWIPVVPPALASIDEPGESIFSVLRRRDVLVHHPYESFTASTEAFIRQAAADPNVLAIKQTLYRTSGDSAIVKALIDAAEAGKQVVVLVELKARFDEKANIAWAGPWRRPASTSCTAWWGSRPTPRPPSSCGRSPTDCAATATWAPATTTPRRPGSTRTSGSCRPTSTCAPTSPTCSTSSPATAATCPTSACWWPPRHCAPD